VVNGKIDLPLKEWVLYKLLDRLDKSKIRDIISWTEVLYRWGLELRYKLYETGIFPSYQLPAPLISIGNLSTGGTGKTPVTIYLANVLKKFNSYPVILTRGFGSKQTKNTMFSPRPNFGIRSKVLQKILKVAGDEALVLLFKTQGIPIFTGKNRLYNSIKAYEIFKPDVYILDDGFHYFTFKREVDILVIDASNPFDNGRLLPAGLLREPVKSSARADVIWINKIHCADNAILRKITHTLRKYNKTAILVFSSYEFKVRNMYFEEIKLKELIKKRIFLFGGIGNFREFLQSSLKLGVNICGYMKFPDHHFYTKEDIVLIEQRAKVKQCDIFFTTLKDFVKIGYLLGEKCYFIDIDIKIEKGKDKLFNFIREKCNLRV